MATAIKLPSVGTNVDAVTLLGWLKEVGDSVRRGEPICEIETDKAVTELESAGQGVLLAQMAEAGTSVSEGQILAYVGQPGEQVPEAQASSGDAPNQSDRATGQSAGQGQPSPPTAPPAPSPAPPAAAATQADQADEPAPTPAAASAPMAAASAGRPIPAGPGGRAGRASVLIRTLARRAGVDLSTVAGTGPGGFITRDDLNAAIRNPASVSPATGAAAPAAGTAPGAAPQPTRLTAPCSGAPRSAVYQLQLDLSAVRREARSAGHEPDYAAALLDAAAAALRQTSLTAEVTGPANVAAGCAAALSPDRPAGLAIGCVRESVISRSGCLRSAMTATVNLTVDADRVSSDQAEGCLSAMQTALERS
jgi:pyruvate/2-oxoglutarate dehydrogenase complex dihydrolipoamide acyltransferase (E2) component